jgi:hypothetical protein
MFVIESAGRFVAKAQKLRAASLAILARTRSVAATDPAATAKERQKSAALLWVRFRSSQHQLAGPKLSAAGAGAPLG